MSTTTTTRRPTADPGLTSDSGRKVRRTTPFGVVVSVVAVVWGALWLVPLLWAVSTSLKPEGETTRTPISLVPTDPTLDAFRSVLSAGGLPRWLLNSLTVAVVVTFLTLVLSVMAAYAFSRLEWPGRKFFFALTIAGILVPPQLLIVPLFQEMVALGLVDTYAGIILPQVIAPVFVFVLKKFFDAVPREYEEAARVDGAGSIRILWNVLLPMSKPILAAVGIFTFIGAWNNFLWPFIVVTNPDMMTVPVGLASVQGSFGLRYAQIMASALVGGLPLLVVYALFQRQVVRGVGDAGIKG